MLEQADEAIYETVKPQRTYQIKETARVFLSVIPAVKGDFSKRGYQGTRTGCFFDLIGTLRLHRFIDGFIGLF